MRAVVQSGGLFVYSSLRRASFFIFFGINLLIASYRLTSPHYFVLTFFASNFIILFSGAILVGFSIQVFIRVRGKSDISDEADEKESPFENDHKEE